MCLHGNPIHALKDSISFGRFMSESLAWEKWSSFSHNRYVEEAEKYSRPGSVAQKKAFFEAHYKRIAAMKAAALQESENAAANHVPEPDFEGRIQNITTHNPQKTAKSQVTADEEKEEKAMSTKAGFPVNSNEYSAKIEKGELEISKVEGNGQVVENQVLVENSIRVELSSQFGNVDNNNVVNELELSETTQMEKPLLKNSSSDQGGLAANKNKPALSSSRPSVYSRASIVPSSPAKPIATTVPKKENKATPTSRKSIIDSFDKKRLTPKSLHMSVNFTPARETNKLSSPIIRNIESSRAAGGSSKPSKDCSTPLRTPITGSVNMATKQSSATPKSENRRARTPLDSLVSGSRTIGPKWSFLSVGCSKSPSVNKSESPTVSNSFSLRTDERAARRKKKLEENFNAKEAQKVQMQTTLKEKAESEIKRLRQTLCFKARPLPDFYKERETPENQIKKIPLTHPRSPKPGRKPSPSTEKSTISLPPRRPLIKKSSSKHIPEKNGSSPVHSHTSLAEMFTHENTSPNIQHL